MRCAYVGSSADHICGPALYYYLCGTSPHSDLSDDDLRRSGCARDHNRDPVDRKNALRALKHPLIFPAT